WCTLYQYRGKELGTQEDPLVMHLSDMKMIREMILVGKEIIYALTLLRHRGNAEKQNLLSMLQ
ncbi:mCG146238, partial [Mus musculus]